MPTNNNIYINQTNEELAFLMESYVHELIKIANILELEDENYTGLQSKLRELKDMIDISE